MFRTIFTTLRALLKSGLCATQLCIRSDTASYVPPANLGVIFPFTKICPKNLTQLDHVRCSMWIFDLYPAADILIRCEYRTNGVMRNSFLIIRTRSTSIIQINNLDCPTSKKYLPMKQILPLTNQLTQSLCCFQFCPPALHSSVRFFTPSQRAGRPDD